MITPVSSLVDLFKRAQSSQDYQRLCIATLSNLGFDHLAKREAVKWKAYYRGLKSYLTSLIDECGYDEKEAESDLVKEINSSANRIDQAKLEWN